MIYNQYVEFINKLSYERYENFDNLDHDTDVFPIMTQIDNEAFLNLNIKELKQFGLGETFPLIHHEFDFKDSLHCLSTVSYYTNAILRFEPQNPYFYHCAVPSAKGIHPCECYYIIKINDNFQLMRFNTAFFGMELIKSKVDEIILEKIIGDKLNEQDILVIIASDIFRLAKYYGSFSFVLSALDAGHIAAQLGMVASRGVQSISSYYHINIKEIADIMDVDYMEIHPELLMHIRLNDSCKKIKIEEKLPCKPRKSFFSDNIRKLDTIVYINDLLVSDSINRPSMCKKQKNEYIITNVKVTDFRVKDFNTAIYNRTSAQNILGTFSLESYISEVVFEKIVHEICKYMKDVCLEKSIKIYCFINNVVNYKRGWYVFEEGIAKLLNNNSTDMSEFLHDSHEFFSIETMPIVIFFSGNIKDFYVKFGMNATKIIYINSAEACQGCSLAFSRYQYFARPFKNLNECYVEACLNCKPEERITYMLAIGKNNISSIDLEVI